ncbi:hypothetical protein D3C81_1825840 [compost metagenome]
MQPGECVVDVLHGEHDAQVSEGIHRGVAVIGDHGRRQKPGYLEPAVTVRRAHHGNLDTHVLQSRNAICPVAFDRRAAFELKAQLGEKPDGSVNVFYNNADVVHTLERHDVSLAL